MDVHDKGSRKHLCSKERHEAELPDGTQRDRHVSARLSFQVRVSPTGPGAGRRTRSATSGPTGMSACQAARTLGCSNDRSARDRLSEQELLLVERSAGAFLYNEALLLDHYKYREWLGVLSADVSYQAPIRTSREAAHAPGYSDVGYHFDETWGRLEQRVRRLETEYAWAEDPPSRTRRFVTNVLVDPTSSRRRFTSRHTSLWPGRGLRTSSRTTSPRSAVTFCEMKATATGFSAG